MGLVEFLADVDEVVRGFRIEFEHVVVAGHRHPRADRFRQRRRFGPMDQRARPEAKPSGGIEIRIDGVDVREMDRRELDRRLDAMGDEGDALRALIRRNERSDRRDVERELLRP